MAQYVDAPIEFDLCVYQVMDRYIKVWAKFDSKYPDPIRTDLFEVHMKDLLKLDYELYNTIINDVHCDAHTQEINHYLIEDDGNTHDN